MAMCSVLAGPLDFELKKKPHKACIAACKDDWKDEGHPGVNVTLVTGAVEFGFPIGDNPPGTARVSSCNEASLTLSSYPASVLPAGNPALAAARVAERQSAQERGINALGYRLLDEGRAADAIILFRWNAANFPNSANVYEGLGAAHLKAGDLVPAIRNYQRALLLDPERASARRVLEDLTKRANYPRNKPAN
jgi:tetratricopeptide (TPR) repeat protein